MPNFDEIDDCSGNKKPSFTWTSSNNWESAVLKINKEWNNLRKRRKVQTKNKQTSNEENERKREKTGTRKRIHKIGTRMFVERILHNQLRLLINVFCEIN